MNINTRSFVQIFLCAFAVLLCRTASAQTITDWEYTKDGADNQHLYGSKIKIPPGSEIRIRVVKATGDAIKLDCRADGVGGAIPTIGSWPKVADGQVISTKMTRDDWRIAIGVSGHNYWNEVAGIEKKEGYHIMRFKGGMVIEIKVIGPAF